VTDVNDLAPVFSKPLYTAVIAEKTRPNVLVTTVTATDVDGPYIKYSLDPRGTGFFVISDNGEIKTGTTELDREASPVKAFGVIADDGKYQTTAEVMVNLTDVNDHAPRYVIRILYCHKIIKVAIERKKVSTDLRGRDYLE